MTREDIDIRMATGWDRDAILAVISDAFGTRSDDDIALVEKIWQLPGHLPSLELVAAVENVVVGHALYSKGHVGSTAVPGLAPLAVATAHQGHGIGSELVTRSLRLAEAAGFPLVIVTGRPEYYTRFGFTPASEYGVSPTNPQDYVDLGAFMAKPLGTKTRASGTFVYAWQTPAGPPKPPL